jgi:hypothetical protein
MTAGPLPARTCECVLAVGDVTDMVQGLDLPVLPDPGGEFAGPGLVGGEAGDRVDGHGLPASAAAGPGLAGDADGVGGVRELQPQLNGHHLDRPSFGAAVPAVALDVPHPDLPPRQLFELVIQRWLVLLHHQDEAGVLLLDQEGASRCRRPADAGPVPSTHAGCARSCGIPPARASRMQAGRSARSPRTAEISVIQLIATTQPLRLGGCRSGPPLPSCSACMRPAPLAVQPSRGCSARHGRFSRTGCSAVSN